MFERTRRFFRRRGERTVRGAERLVGAKEIKGGWSFISDMWQGLRRQKPRREETFANAYIRLGHTEDSLALTHRHYYIRFYIILMLAAVAIGMLIYSLLEGSWVTLGPGIAFLAISMSILFSSSFRLYQIERRELVDVSEWARAPGSWLPAPFRKGVAPKPGQQEAAIIPLHETRQAGKGQSARMER